MGTSQSLAVGCLQEGWHSLPGEVAPIFQEPFSRERGSSELLVVDTAVRGWVRQPEEDIWAE